VQEQIRTNFPAFCSCSCRPATAHSSQNLAVLSQDGTILSQNLRVFTRQAASQCSPDKEPGGNRATDSWEVNMSTESILGLESNSPDSAERAPSDSNVDARLNTLRETVLQLLDEVESLAISRPVDIKRGARFSDEVRQFEVSLIRTALGRTSGSQTRAARLLGLKPTTLNAKIKRYGITA
jgi:transcriptional regulator with GAF, ATPase, and Fis domain